MKRYVKMDGDLQGHTYRWKGGLRGGTSRWNDVYKEVRIDNEVHILKVYYEDEIDVLMK